MEIANQIKRLRTESGMSQDELAEKVFVSRQTVSNWENEKTYPDLKSLLLLSEVFGTSLDALIKGDLSEMKRQIDGQEYAKFMRNSVILTVMYFLILLTPIPLAHFLGWWGLAIYIVIFAVTMFFAVRIEKYKKKYDIRTYKEISAFMNGKSLTEIEKAREEGKRPYQKVLFAICSALLALAVCAVMAALFWKIFG